MDDSVGRFSDSGGGGQRGRDESEGIGPVRGTIRQ